MNHFGKILVNLIKISDTKNKKKLQFMMMKIELHFIASYRNCLFLVVVVSQDGTFEHYNWLSLVVFIAAGFKN